jgi:hypothetical protein
MKKLFTLTIASCFLAIASFGQTSFGIKAGVNNSSWKGDATQSLNDLMAVTNGYLSTGTRTGFYAGGFAEIPVGNKFSIEPGLYYSQKGYEVKGELSIDKIDFLGASATATLQSHYIDMPVLVKAEVARGLKIYAGPQLSYLVKNNLNLRAGALGFDVLNTNMDVTNQFKTVDVSLVGGVGYKFDNGLSIEAGYDHGLSRIDKNSNFKSYNRTFKVGLGFTF